MSTFQRPLKVGKIDNFTLSLSSAYLEGEVLNSVTVTTESEALNVGLVKSNGAVISAVCTGVSPGDVPLKFAWATDSRSGCETHVVRVLEC